MIIKQMIEFIGTSTGVIKKDQVVYDDSYEEIEDLDKYLLEKMAKAMDDEYTTMLEQCKPISSDEEDQEDKRFEANEDLFEEFLMQNTRFHFSELNRLENNL